MRSGSAFAKAIVLVVLAILMLVPLMMLQSLVAERAHLRAQAVASVSRGWGGAQTISGPVLAIPTTFVSDDHREIERDWYVLPEALNAEAELVVQDERRKLGVYEVPVYVVKMHASASFDLASRIAALTREQRSATVHLDRARLLVPVSDTRGVREVKLEGGALVAGAFEPDTRFPISALAVPLPPQTALDHGEHRFAVDLTVAGTEALSFLPLARATNITLRGNWPHPGFARGFLPIERSVKDGRFQARWQVLDLNRGFGGHWLQGETTAEVLTASAFGVDVVQPVDLYQRAERSVKYGGLFIAITLMTLFLWEHLACKPLHPIQYGLVALALSVFYLLLLALAEQIGFAKAYWAAALALCSLLGIYLAGAFRQRMAGGGSAAAFGGVYALLYLLITSEDYALLAGALGLFAILAAVMLVTRKLDWYRSGVTPEGGDRASR